MRRARSLPMQQNTNLKQAGEVVEQMATDSDALNNIFTVLADLAIDSYLGRRKKSGVEKPILPA